MLHAEAVAGLRRQGRLGTLARALTGQAWAAVLLGDARLALTASSEARALGEETGYSELALVADLSRAAALALRGETAAAADALEDAESALVPVGRQALFPMLQLARGLSALASGHPDDAYEQLVRVFSAGDAGFHPSQKFAALAHLAEAAAKSGQLDRLRPIVAELMPVAAATKSPALVMSLAYAEALLARDAARATLRCALEADLSAWPFERARLQVAYGAKLRHGHRRRDSRSYLRAAGETLTRWGPDGGPTGRGRSFAPPVRRYGGQRSRRPAQPARLQIATMAAQGLTNRQIASQLFLSPRTVSTHLYPSIPRWASPPGTSCTARLS